MNVELGEAKDVAQLIQIGAAIFQKLKSDGTLGEIGREIAEIHSNIRKHCYKLDVEQLRYYENVGQLSKEQALHLLTVNKLSGCELLNLRKAATKS